MDFIWENGLNKWGNPPYLEKRGYSVYIAYLESENQRYFVQHDRVFFSCNIYMLLIKTFFVLLSNSVNSSYKCLVKLHIEHDDLVFNGPPNRPFSQRELHIRNIEDNRCVS